MIKIFAAIGVIQIISILATILRSKLLAVLLGPEGVGIISVIDQVIQLVSYISAFSLPYAAVKFLSRSHSVSHEAFVNTYASFLRVLLIFSCTGISILVAISLASPEVFGEDLGQYSDYFVVAAFGIPAMMLGGFFNNVLASAEMPQSASILNVFTTVAFLISAYLGVTLGGIYGFYIGNVIAGLCLISGVLIYFNRKLSLPVFRHKKNIFHELKENPDIISFSITMSVTSVAYSSSYLIARHAVLQGYGEAEVGMLHSLLSIAMALGLVLGPLNGYFLTPKVNRNITQDEKVRITIDFQRIFIIILVLTAIPFTLFPKSALYVLFSSEFMVVSNLLFLFVLASVINHITNIYQALIIGLDDIKGFSIINTSGHIVFGFVSWMLVPHVGVVGVGYAFLASALLTFVLFFIKLRVSFNVRCPGKVLFLIAYSVAAIAIGGWVSSYYEEFDLITAFVKVILFAMFSASLLFFLTYQEREKLFSFIIRQNKK